MKNITHRFFFFAVIASAFALTALAQKPASKLSVGKPVIDTAFAHPIAVGVMPCEDKVAVTITKDAKRPDGFDVALGKSHYPATRVATDSGAIRLEHKPSGIVWLQMANKSMLFNEKAGKRLANNCRNEAQTAAEHALSISTAPTVLDGPVIKNP